MVLVFYATVSRWLPGVRSTDLLVTNFDLPPDPPYFFFFFPFRFRLISFSFSRVFIFIGLCDCVLCTFFV